MKDYLHFRVQAKCGHCDGKMQHEIVFRDGIRTVKVCLACSRMTGVNLVEKDDDK